MTSFPSTRQPQKARTVLENILGKKGLLGDWKVGEKVLERDKQRRARLMGTKTNRKMAKIAKELEGRELTAEQQAVVDVYTGKKNNLPITIQRADGKRRIIMRKGKEDKKSGGTLYSLFKHFDTTEGVFESNDVIKIPEIIKNGSCTPSQRRGKTVYEYVWKDANGTIYTVVTERTHNREEFADFYTNKKGSSAARQTHSEEARAVTDENLSPAKLHKVSETDKENTTRIFDAAKKKFGVTKDIREAGYVLLDGTMLDFSGRHELMPGDDSSFLKGRRSPTTRLLQAPPLAGQSPTTPSAPPPTFDELTSRRVG